MCSVEKVVLKSFTIFTGKTLQACNFVKKRLQLRCFPANNAKFFKKNYFEKYLRMATSGELLLEFFSDSVKMLMADAGNLLILEKNLTFLDISKI